MMKFFRFFAFLCGVSIQTAYAEVPRVENIRLYEASKNMLLDYTLAGQEVDAFFEDVLARLHKGQTLEITHNIDVHELTGFGWEVAETRIQRFVKYNPVLNVYEAGTSLNFIKQFSDETALKSFLLHAYGAQMGFVSDFHTGWEYDISVQVSYDNVTDGVAWADVLSLGLLKKTISAQETYIAR